MARNILREGDKIEFREILTPKEEQNGKQPTIYVSQLFEENADGSLQVAMPILRGRLVPLMRGENYDAYFFTEKGIFCCRAEIVDLLKSEHIFSMKIVLKTELLKQQRRQYFRLEKNIDILYAKLSDENYKTITETGTLPEPMTDPEIYEKGVTADISGGGMRFIGKKKTDAGEKIFIVFEILKEEEPIRFRLPGTVIRSFRLENQEGYEHRIVFENISRKYREILIKYIFEEERRMRKNSR